MSIARQHLMGERLIPDQDGGPAHASATDAAAPAHDLAELLGTVMRSRQTILPRRLLAPGPGGDELAVIFEAAATAPDHGRLLPWRFIVVPSVQRDLLAAAFANALQQRDPAATPEQVVQAKEKAYRSPFLLLVVVDERAGDPGIDLAERIVATGCAVQNMLLMATALGYGSALTSGKALKSSHLRQLFQLADGEHALCFVSIGTVQSAKRARVRPVPGDFVSAVAGAGSPRPDQQTSAPAAAPRSTPASVSGSDPDLAPPSNSLTSPG
jgi:nitroreductase